MGNVGELCLQCGFGFGGWFGEVDIGKPSVRACNVSDRREMFIWLLYTLAKVPLSYREGVYLRGGRCRQCGWLQVDHGLA